MAEFKKVVQRKDLPFTDFFDIDKFEISLEEAQQIHRLLLWEKHSAETPWSLRNDQYN